jgi:hypothetical protein
MRLHFNLVLALTVIRNHPAADVNSLPSSFLTVARHHQNFEVQLSVPPPPPPVSQCFFLKRLAMSIRQGAFLSAWLLFRANQTCMSCMEQPSWTVGNGVCVQPAAWKVDIRHFPVKTIFLCLSFKAEMHLSRHKDAACFIPFITRSSVS